MTGEKTPLEHYFHKHSQAQQDSSSPIFEKGNCFCVKPHIQLQLNQRKKQNLIGYVRALNVETATQKVALLKQYCSENGYRLLHVKVEVGPRPSFELAAALDDLAEADGLIATDLDQFFPPTPDRLRELKPFVHHFFCSHAKHLITIEDGIDTGTVVGQENALELIAKVKGDE